MGNRVVLQFETISKDDLEKILEAAVEVAREMIDT